MKTSTCRYIHRIIPAIAMILAVAMASPQANAQIDAQFSQYYEIPAYYNPAAAGEIDFVNIHGGTRQQWVGIENAPSTFVLTADMPLKLFGKRFGIGLMVHQESIGLYKTMNLGIQMAYRFKLFGGQFSAGLQLGLLDQSFKGTDIYIPDDDDFHESDDDALPQNDIRGNAFDIGAGIWYTHRLFWAGVGATHLNSPTLTMKSDNAGSSGTQGDFEFQAGRTLYFTAGSNIKIKNTLFEVIPTMLVKSDFTFTTAELTARVRYNRFISIGVGYRYKDAIIGSLAVNFKNIYVGYSYDYATSAIGKASSGSHEVIVGYRLKLNMGEKNKNRHKNIRIM